MCDGTHTTFKELINAGHLELGDGYRTKRAEHGQPGLPILRVAEVLDGRIDPKFEDFISDHYRAAMGSKISRPGDIILTTKGTVGRVAIMPREGPDFVYSPQVCYFRTGPASPLVREYLYYWFKSEQFWSQALSLKGQTDMADYINLADIRSLRIILKPKPLQEAIAAVLGAIDNKISINERIALTCHGLAESLFQWTTKASESVSLSSMVDPILGGTPDRTIAEYWGPGYLWASAKDVVASKFGTLIATEEQVTELAVTQTKVKPVAKGSVILTARGTVGAVARVAQPTALNQSCYAFVPSRIPSGVLYLMVRAATQQMSGMAHGTVFSTVNMKSFDHIHAPVLGKAGLEALEGEVSPLFDMIEIRTQENKSLSNLRDALLPKLTSGEIRVRDAERIVEDAT